MIFSERHGTYYRTVAKILAAAVDHPLEKGEMSGIIARYAFGESMLLIGPSLSGGDWPLLTPDGRTTLKNIPTLPVSLTQRRWLAAICRDPRIRLFTDGIPGLEGVEPLFDAEDIVCYDRYADGDDFGSGEYIRNFRAIRDAIRRRVPLAVDFTNRKGNITHTALLPHHLEYSEKDDKFRLYATGSRYGGVVNLGRIQRCYPYKGKHAFDPAEEVKRPTKEVTFIVTDRRNALERVMMHFAHLEKEAERLGEKQYRVTVRYDAADVPEMVIRLLSFGPLVKVTGPDEFMECIRIRLKRQMRCGL